MLNWTRVKLLWQQSCLMVKLLPSLFVVLCRIHLSFYAHTLFTKPAPDCQDNNAIKTSNMHKQVCIASDWIDFNEAVIAHIIYEVSSLNLIIFAKRFTELQTLTKGEGKSVRKWCNERKIIS